MLVRVLLVLLLVLACPAARASEIVQLATYYDYAPWYVPGDPEAGLNAKLARKLSAMSGGRYRFESVYFPRKRLDVLLQSGKLSMVVPWVHPRFFGDIERTRYSWTGPLMEDESLIVSPRAAPLEYDGPASLRGKRFGAPAGHLFPDFEPLIASGEITRFDVPQIKNALIMMLVANRRLDFTIIDRSTLDALKDDPFMDQSLLHIASRARTPSYERSILVPKDKPELYDFLNKAVARLGAEKGWIAGNRVVRITSGDWPPYQGKNLPHLGAGQRIVTEAFALQGIDVEYEFFPWRRAYVLANTPAWDGGALWARSPARERDFYFSEPVVGTNTILMYLKGAPLEWTTLADLGRYRIGITSGYFYGPQFMAAVAGNKLAVQSVSTDLQNLQKLLAGHIDVFPVDKVVGLTLLRQNFSKEDIERVAIARKVLYSQSLHLMLKKSHPESRLLIEQFNIGLRRLKANGQVNADLRDLLELDADILPQK